MLKIVILTTNTIASEQDWLTSLIPTLSRAGFDVSCSNDLREPFESLPAINSSPDLLLVNSSIIPSNGGNDFLRFCQENRLPMIIMVNGDDLTKEDVMPSGQDFVVCGASSTEVLIRIRQVLSKATSESSDNAVQVDDMLIDFNSYEVSVSGRRVLLTYKEFQLLKLLATNPGVVFSRENLLDHVWGYDYFGGNRTVDVHIRRLRGKIEDAYHSYIETVWQVGYRFKHT